MAADNQVANFLIVVGSTVYSTQQDMFTPESP